MSLEIGRWSQLNNEKEVSKLTVGLDFRLPIYRREVFIRFFEFALKYKAHPGGVYRLLPFLFEELEMDIEQRLFAAYLNGCTQNPVTTYLLFKRWPRLELANPEDISNFVKDNWARVFFDQDRRYYKIKLGECVQNYQLLMKGRTQVEFFKALTPFDNPEENFKIWWDVMRRSLYGFGRLSTWSYGEYLRILGLPIEPHSLLLEDMEGSKSHRNGLAKILGRDDLDWHKSNPSFNGEYSEEMLRWLNKETEDLLQECRIAAYGTDYYDDVNLFTLESALCTWKSWHRPNRRYSNCYWDMNFNRIREAEKAWPEEDFSLFWRAREFLPDKLRLEKNPRDFGLHSIKQNWYLNSGEVPMLSVDDPVFACGYDELLED